MIKFLTTLLLILVSIIPAEKVHSNIKHDIDSVYSNFAKFKFKAGNSLLDSILKKDSLNIEANYLKAELFILRGEPDYIKFQSRLENIGAEKELAILDLKLALLLGESTLSEKIPEALRKFPDTPEIEFIKWLWEIDQNGIEKVAHKAWELSQKILFKPLPYLALFNYASDLDPQMTLCYLDTLESLAGTVYHSRNRPLLELLTQINTDEKTDTKKIIELEYADCGPGMGFYMTDVLGNKIKMELDTGSSSGLFSIHSDSIGKTLSGKDSIVIKNGIWFNYMDGPKDMHYKLVDFESPQIKNLVTGYFDGKFSKADGCFSPFAFEGYSITIDPLNQKAFLRNRKAAEEYLNGLSNPVEVNYVVRNGWIFIPCKINGKEVFMMVETGSRDVNLNKIALNRLGIEPYQGSILWRGENYPIEKVDFTLEISSLKYTVTGGLVSDFVMGNSYYGIASAGDIGPEFFRNFVFTIDPFGKRLVIEQAANLDN
jgi:hypothetical protein